MNLRSQILVAHEYNEIGKPLWRFASSRNETVTVYARASLALDEDGNYHRNMRGLTNAYQANLSTWIQTFSEKLEPMDFPCENPFAVYRPFKERQLHQLCAATVNPGFSEQLVSPVELTIDDLNRIAEVSTRTSRHVLFLTKHDLCGNLRVPWLYFLGLYYFDRDRTVFLASSEAMLEEYRGFTAGVPDFRERSIDAALSADQEDWKRNYRQFEAKEPGKYWNPTC